MNDPTANPIFVIGPPRSGTTLLCTLLNQHSDVAVMHECGILDFSPVLRRDGVNRDWPDRLEVFSEALSRHDLHQCDWRGQDIANRREAASALYAEYGRRQDVAVAGEKVPRLCSDPAAIAG